MGGKKPIIIPGIRYGYLVLTGAYFPGWGSGKNKVYAKVECICDCGKVTLKGLSNLTLGQLKSCSSKCPYTSNSTHGLTRDENGKITKEYKAWNNMINKCNNPRHNKYFRILRKVNTYHESLSTPEGFLKIMGRAPSKYHRLARINKNGDYEPGNVHWYLPINRKSN